MTVQELIDILHQCNRQADVLVNDSCSGIPAPTPLEDNEVWATADGEHVIIRGENP